MNRARMKAESGRRKEFARSAGSSLVLHRSSLALCLGLLVPGAASAQVANDPMRPPVGYADAVPDSGAGGGLRLQSVMISPTQRWAIINGVLVKLGEKYGNAVLVRVVETEVVLKSGGTQEVLKLHPGVLKREIVPGAGAGGPPGARVPADSARSR